MLILKINVHQFKEKRESIFPENDKIGGGCIGHQKSRVDFRTTLVSTLDPEFSITYNKKIF